MLESEVANRKKSLNESSCGMQNFGPAKFPKTIKNYHLRDSPAAAMRIFQIIPQAFFHQGRPQQSCPRWRLRGWPICVHPQVVQAAE